MLNRKTAIAFISIFAAVLIFSCGGSGGGGNTGQGGPDVSPENISTGSTGSAGGTTTATTTVAGSTTNTELTGTTSPSEGLIVEPEVNTTIEGTIDTGADTGTTTAAGVTDGAGTDTTNAVTNNTDITTVSEDISVILTGGTDTGTGDSTATGGTSTGSGTTVSDTGSSTGTDTTSTGSDTAASGTGSSTVTDTTSTGSDTTASGTGSSTGSGTTSTGSDTAASGTGSSTGTDTTSTGSDTAASGTGSSTVTDTTSTGSGTTSSDTGITAGAEDTGAAGTVEDLENDEDVDQGNLVYTIDSSLGKWFKTIQSELISLLAITGTKAQIALYRNEIKGIAENYKKGKIKHDEAVIRLKALRKKVAELRASIGNGGRLTDGITTYWANQNLYLNIKSGQPGWYRLVIVAKNQGVLPDDYDRFSFSVNEGNDTITSISVKASDKAYFRGSSVFKLDKTAGTQLNILWTNDAFHLGKYDTNVNIKKIALIKIKEPSQKLKTVKKFKGDQYTYTDGRWFFDKNEAYTYWSDQVIGYTFKNMEEGQYEVTIEAMNHGTLPLPKDYKEFNVEVDSEYDSASVAIPADSKNWEKETFTMNFPEGDTTLYLTWINDSFKENSYDTNFKIRFVSVKKVKQSNLTAYLLKTKPGNRVFILSAFLMISAVLLGIYMKNRKSEDSAA